MPRPSPRTPFLIDRIVNPRTERLDGRIRPRRMHSIGQNNHLKVTGRIDPERRARKPHVPECP